MTDGEPTDPLRPDTDGDGLLDGTDRSDAPETAYYAAFVALGIVRKGGSFLGELSRDGDPNEADTDGDGLPDGWEAKFGASATALVPGEDPDDDGLTNADEYALGTRPDDGDTDGDGMGDGWESDGGLDPLHSGTHRFFLNPDHSLGSTPEADAREGQAGDPDLDGANNWAEWTAGTSPTTPDSDGDGLIDGTSQTVARASERFELWTSMGIPYTGRGATVAFLGEASMSPATDPAKPDTDGDGVLDGQEVYGYNVTVTWYVGKDLRSRDVFVRGCPTQAYKAPNCSTWLDVDGDGITDRDEVEPLTSTRKGVKDFVAKYKTNQTMMDSQFNPFVRENVPPVLVEATAQSGVLWGTCWFVPCVKRAWTSVYVRTLDVNPSTVKVIAGSGLRLVLLLAGNAWVARGVPEGSQPVTVQADIDYWTEYLVRYEVLVNLPCPAFATRGSSPRTNCSMAFPTDPTGRGPQNRPRPS